MKIKLKVKSGCTGVVKPPGAIVEVSQQKAKYMVRTKQAEYVPKTRMPPPPNAKATKKAAEKAESGLSKKTAHPERRSSKSDD